MENESIVDNILQQHKGAIVKFAIGREEVQDLKCIERWIEILLDHPIKFLDIALKELDFQPHTYYLSDKVFSFHCLEELLLAYAQVKLPPGFRGFNNLVKLDLSRIVIKFEEVQAILSKCPVLEFFDMFACDSTSVWSLHVDAPKLKQFYFWGLFTSITFSSPYIEDITIGYNLALIDCFEIRNLCENESKVVALFNHLQSIRKASIQEGLLEFLALGGVVEKLPNNFNYLTCLEFEMVDFKSMDDIISCLCLIRSSPNLQDLTIIIADRQYTIDDQVVDIQYLREQQQACDVRLNQLRNVAVYEMEDLEAEIEFLKVLLAWASSPEKLEITLSFDGELDDSSLSSRKANMIGELSNFLHASPKSIKFD